MNSANTSRRTFLRGTVAGAAGLATLPTWAKPIGSNGEVRVAVIGFKSRGSGHIGSLLKIPGVRLVALCDVDSEVMAKQVAALGKRETPIKVKQYKDFRECCADPDIDAVTIATPNHSHTLIALTAIANGKHVYVEKPVSHNMWEGRKLVDAAAIAEKKGLVVQHGMQRRSDLGWASAMEYVKSGQIGKTTLSRGINYKARKSIGKLDAPVPAKDVFAAGTFKGVDGKATQGELDYKLWSAPRPMLPVNRSQFHYDWHWQWAYGNGDIGNQGPHQLDVARWALGNPAVLPKRVMSFGGRWGYDDDGETANNQMAFYDYAEGAPLLFDNRGLPMKDMNWAKGAEPVYRINGKTSAPRIGNVIHCEGGFIAESKAYDNDGKAIHKFENFQDGPDHMLNFINSVRAGKLTKDVLHVSHGYHAAALAQMANISYRLGKQISNDEVKERLSNSKAAQETFDHFVENLVANKIDMKAEMAQVGPWLDFDPVAEKFTGEFAEEANKMTNGDYAAGFELPVIS
ncbi:Gfo/Idh/MocA family protein [Prosthecobacter dejongeii]|uniref:Putative dehydrogenase n=1 Tax=Prosthecobacter dejongeii TaxID=48465 RepID=A0A7W8DNL7_9BACT|nr:Gfo/Idh/MocA family oxidoreductase [Prosthecobacter dejongeii]MBB5036679.1 putative dehydrogenase [Prosthecobacter dejongeii]